MAYKSFGGQKWGPGVGTPHAYWKPPLNVRGFSKSIQRSNAMSEVSRGEVIDIIVKSALENPAYRAALLKDPKAVLAKQMNTELPSNLTVKVLQETADTIYLIAPYVAPKEGDELSDSDLERVAGGKGGQKGDRTENNNRYTCNDSIGIGTRVEVHVSA